MLRIKSQEELDAVAVALLEKYPRQRIFAFFGSMGVGKTTFIKSICKRLQVTDLVDSPSFSIVNQYMTSTDEPVYHFDFYRIRKLEEVYDLGYEDYFFSGSYCLIEWPEKMQILLPENCVKVFMEEQEGERIIKF